MPDAKDYLLLVEDLHAYYTSKRGLVRAVEDVTFGVKRGESVGLFGESGAGKTSVALAVLGLFERLAMFGSDAGSTETKRLWALRRQAREQGLTSKDMGEDLPGVEGKVWFDGRDLMELDEEELRKLRGKEIAYVPQTTMASLNPYMTIEYQTAEGLLAHEEYDDLSEDQVAAMVLESLDLVELADPTRRRRLKPKEFAMGEDQRVLIAMALITRPRLLIADEPTTALDMAVRHKIMRVLSAVREKTGMATLIISNDAGLIAEVTDRVVVMSAGRVMESADVTTIFKRPGHPFTRAFLLSNPTMEVLRRIRERGLRIRGIPGRPPDMTSPPPGCPFHPRCEYATEMCRDTLPEYREVEDGHWVMCHRYEELPPLEL